MPNPPRRPNVLFSAPPEEWSAYAAALPRACEDRGVPITLLREAERPAEIDYIVYDPGGGLEDFSPYGGLRAVLSLWAGVEKIAPNPTLTVPLTRMVDAGLAEGMRDYVVGHVMRYHLDLDGHLARQDGAWRHEVMPPLASERTVAVLGQGALGSAAAEALAALGFRTLGWSRSPKPPLPGIERAHGEDGLAQVLSRAEILVLLLPATPETENLLDATRLSLLPRGARVVNPGRGTLIEDGAFLRALDTGQVGHATLDVFRTEPLPADHPYWAHPRVTVTPHIAAATRPRSASEVIAENIRRAELGEPLLYEVDRARGY